MSDIDAALSAYINSGAGHFPIFDFLMILITTIGVPVLVLAVVMQWWLPRSDRPTRHVLISAGLSFAVGLGFNQLILLFVQRVRPYDAHITHLIIHRNADFSFPSDHATASFAIAAAFLLNRMPRRGFIFVLAAMPIAVSRVYIGMHYVTDVFGGAGTGILAAIMVHATYREGSKLDHLVTGIL